MGDTLIGEREKIMAKIAYINGTILDGTKDMKPVKGMTIFTEDGRITRIAPITESTSGYETYDITGKYIMPGLINMHVHLPGTGRPKKQRDNARLVRILTSNALLRKVVYEMCASSARTQLLSGVTTLRTVGGVQNVDSKIRNDINRGRKTGPRMLVANMAVSVPGGHMAGSLAYEATTEREARKKVRIIAGDKPDLIKLMITGGVLDSTIKGEPGLLRMSPEIVAAAADEAHKLGYKVAAHVESTEGLKVALENGVDYIEHGAAVNDEIIGLFKKTGAVDVLTITPALPFAICDRSFSRATELGQYNGKVVMDGMIECAKACLKNDIPVLLGTDSASLCSTQYGTWRELVLFSKYCEVDPSFALYTATLRSAETLGIADETGSIAIGKRAEMIVTAENPLEDLHALRNVWMVVFGEKVYKDIRLKKIKVVEDELDKYM